jgi:hypothetical protein
MFGNEDSLLAARTVCASMSTQQKQQLLCYISSIPTVGEGIDENEAKERIIKTLNLTESDKNSVAESTKFKQQLNEKNKDWLYAVMKCDFNKADELFKSVMEKHLHLHLHKYSQKDN